MLEAADEGGVVRARLGFLLGQFSGPETLHETAWTRRGSAVGRTVGRVVSTTIVQEQVQEREGAASFSALNVFAIDPATSEVVLYSFDTLGYLPEPPARGAWSDGELILLRATARGQSRTRYTQTSSGYRWWKEIRASDDEDWAIVVEGRLDREGPTRDGTSTEEN